jgi:ligand-binding SRPBCC domain-containing protein
MGKEEEMRLEVTDKVQNPRLVTRQTQGPFNRWESVQEFQANADNKTHVRHEIDYELPTTGKIANVFTDGDAESKQLKLSNKS